MVRPSPTLSLETAAGVLAWAVAAAPAIADLASGSLPASSWRVALAGVAWALFGAGFVAIASWSLSARGDAVHRWVLATLTALAATCTAALPDYGILGILFILTAVVAAHVLPEPGALAWIAGQTGWVAFATGLTAPPSAALLQAAAYGSFMLFAYLTTRAGLREAAARSEAARRAAELAATRHLLVEHERVGERLRIARDLHDLLGHRLTALVLNLDVAGRSEGAASREAVARAEGLARSLLDAVREAVRTVRSEDAVDVAGALRALVADLPEPEVVLELPERIEIADPRAAHALLSCAQEVVTNTVRHAGARRLRIAVQQTDAGVTLHARDDGSGAGSGGAVRRGSSGLSGMRERIDALGGRLEVVPDAAPGFAVRAFLPSGPASADAGPTADAGPAAGTGAAP
jgi:signal transduction histidine kinase